MFSKEKLVILDGFALIFRAYYAFIRNPLRTSNGIPTSALFGFMRMLIKIIKTYEPDYFVVALDSEGPSFRKDVYNEYKANRKEAPEDLKIQIPLVIELIKKLKLAQIEMKQFEADDIIGTLCEKYRNHKDLDVLVVTGDKDILQLVGDNIKVITTSKGISEVVEYDKEKVKEKWGVYPEKIIDLFALMGDSSDNVPGVKGVGPKAAQELLARYSSVEDIYHNINGVTKKKLKENLETYEDNAILSKELVTIKTDLEIDLELNDFKNLDLNQEEARNFLNEYELNSILKDDIFSKSNSDAVINTAEEKTLAVENNAKDIAKAEAAKEKNKNYKAILSAEDFENLKEIIKKAEILSIDLETTSEDPMIADIIGFAFSVKVGEGYYLPIEHEIKCEIEKEQLYNELKDICEDKSIAKIGQNIKYDYMILKRYGIELQPIVFDTMLASYILDPGRKSHGMDHLAEEFLSHKTVQYKEIVDKGQTLLDLDIDTVVHYASEDADITLQLFHIFKDKIDGTDLNDIYYNLELPLLTVLARMELEGVEIDADYFKNMSVDIKERLDYLQKEIWELSDTEFNINSTKQLAEVLFTKLGLTPKKKTKTGYSTDVSVLEELAQEHQVPLHLLEYRKLTKLKSAYLDSIPKLINEKTKRVHTSFNQTIAQTGRLSSNNPNLQNIPIKEEVGRAIRKGFIANEGNSIISADYSQIELRILAHVSDDDKLINAYQEDKDIHTQTASLIFSKAESDVNSDERRIAKTINFSVIYGIGAVALGKDLKIPSKQAKTFIENYFREYQGVVKYIDEQKRIGFEQGYVTTLFNRIRYIPEIKSSNKRNQSFGERLAVNTPIQGTSADLIKLAMIEIDKEIIEQGLKSKMTIQVHDELVFEVPDNELDLMKKLIIEKMEGVYQLKVPLRVSIHHGKNWDEAH